MITSLSFTQQVKEEICNNEYVSKDRVLSLLSAYIRINGTLLFKNKSNFLILKTQNAKVAKFIYQNIENQFSCHSHINYLTLGNTKKKIYSIVIEEKVDFLLEKLSVSFLEGKIPKDIVFNDDTISGYLLGAFLACGSINSPSTSNYHLELSLNNENYAKWLSKLFTKFKNNSIEPKLIIRREKYVLYLKKGDQIADFLIMIGAVNSCMDFENSRVERDFANSANRLNNSDMANMKKTYETGQRQIKEIMLIDEKVGIKNISNIKERNLCILRLENETASMNDLAVMLSDVLNVNVTKSNINHLFRSIHNRYERLKK